MFIHFYSASETQANNHVAAVKHCVDCNDEQKKPLHHDTPVSVAESTPDACPLTVENENADNRNAASENRKSECADVVVESN